MRANSTKGEVLAFLSTRLRKSIVDEFVSFTVANWITSENLLLESLTLRFAGASVIIRSSTLHEDLATPSKAGHFHSVPDTSTSDKATLKAAIQAVIASYSKNNRMVANDDQILIQRYVADADISGVVLTQDIRFFPDYYLINYDDSSGQTNTVTGGICGRLSRFARWLPLSTIEERWRLLLGAIKEIEQLVTPGPLDIEFVIDRGGRIHTLQVRAIQIASISSTSFGCEATIQRLQTRARELMTLSQRLPGKFTLLADMPDWNPAEILGGRSDVLDHSLYAFLITDGSWNRARVSLGYTDVAPSPLMLRLGDKSYIDVRVSLNSLTPASFVGSIREEVMEYYLAKLKMQPELQDKIEFEVVLSCIDFDSGDRLRELQRSGIAADGVEQLRRTLFHTTDQILSRAHDYMNVDLSAVRRLEPVRKSCVERVQGASVSVTDLLSQGARLLRACRDLGGQPFSRTARVAFVGVAILKSFVKAGLLALDDFARFSRTIDTVAGRLKRDHTAVLAGSLTLEEFLLEYGHLRPGTYSILASRYDQRLEFVGGSQGIEIEKVGDARGVEVLGHLVPEKIETGIRALGLNYTGSEFLGIVARSLRERERLKFEFTRSLSDAIEILAKAGAIAGFSRSDVSNLDIDTLLKARRFSSDARITESWNQMIAENRQFRHECSRVPLPPFITSPEDLVQVHYALARPQFITSSCVVGEAFCLDAVGAGTDLSLEGKIILCQRADPGYDWIFTHRIRGLITQYGGVASHMAIRCAEFGLPAAIGCGDVVYSRLLSVTRLTLDCENERISEMY